ncbi:hypothetical protein K9O30_06250 [Clostridium bowmanii]|uniref:hypothetical protein n=1 Tax=Clostridium bowmanii TaxID=132925 RepID=UPI001C0C44C1|nr:hypothetical protein [Clostridium bowmanii]MBU3188761.1 hypothetical protein [Clostridium bowmanii]MCA1073346.1 hypothetical protein [Clostridium bowmanii]
MRNKLKDLSVVLICIFSFYLLTNFAVPVEATTSKQVQAAVKVTASVNNKTPKQNSTVNVTVNGPAKGSVKIVCHYKSTNTTYNATIGTNGKAIIPVKISRATKGYAVVTNVSVTYKGKVYTTKTSFTPK